MSSRPERRIGYGFKIRERFVFVAPDIFFKERNVEFSVQSVTVDDDIVRNAADCDRNGYVAENFEVIRYDFARKKVALFIGEEFYRKSFGVVDEFVNRLFDIERFVFGVILLVILLDDVVNRKRFAIV